MHLREFFSTGELRGIYPHPFSELSFFLETFGLIAQET
jgi:hypothetical protein